tara:strand:+ start:66 stop:479 length:414 start_codon:yes stop_codon:yes gene_type:complete
VVPQSNHRLASSIFGDALPCLERETKKERGNTMNDHQLTEYCNDIAKEIAEETSNFDTANEQAHERADGSEYVIYYYKAHQICQNCNIDQGEDFFSDCYGEGHSKSYDEIATIMAYGEIQARISSKLWEIFEAREAA